jgi:NAD(P)-dependent dehydrogenase (short-subunit alcohol dehydrogenase family)
MGLAVATALSALPSWEIHILDINSDRGSQAASTLARTSFHYADVTKYNTLSEAFQNAFSRHKRLDFVFANAGMIERFNFYDPCPGQTTDSKSITPPPEPDLLSIDADLKGVILTTYLAQHYFRASPDQGRGASIVLTASCGGLYPSYYSPLYSSAKCGF